MVLRLSAALATLSLALTLAAGCGAPGGGAVPWLDAPGQPAPDAAKVGDVPAPLADAAGPADVPLPGDAAPDAVAPDVPPTPPPRPFRPPTWVEAPGWVVAVGDVHGDLASALEALQLAGVVDEAGHWIGGDIVLVQVGDQLDRGDDERAILELFEIIADEAHAAGGGFYPLLGNHETMNVEEDFRYVTDGGWADFADVPVDPSDALVAAYPPEQQGRVAAFRPGGPYAKLLARHNVVMVVDDTVFVHGGILPGHVAYGLDAINEETSRWMDGERGLPDILDQSDNPVWSRHYSDETAIEDCLLLEEVLATLGASRMVVAHTVQDFGINEACGGMVWRVDVGLADYYGGPTQVLGILDGEVFVLE